MATVTHDLPTDRLFAGRYKIGRVLGCGGMGTVYLAQDTVLGGEEVALKILHLDRVADDSHVQRFLREVQLTRRVTHPNVVRTFELGQEGEKLFFTMEVVHGTTLKEYAKTHQLEPHEVARLIAEISKGLHAIHEQGVVHRDLKLSNVMVSENGAVKIADFGVARPEVSDLTCTDEIVGSATHMSPEVWKGNPITAATDLYSLGIMAFELLTRQLPFEAQTCHEMMWKHINATPKHPIELCPELPLWLDQLVVRLLAKDPANRFATAYALVEEIAHHLGDPSLLGAERSAVTTGAFSQAVVAAAVADAELSHSFLETPEGMLEDRSNEAHEPRINEPLVESLVTNAPVAANHSTPISAVRMVAASSVSVIAFGLICAGVLALTSQLSAWWGVSLIATLSIALAMSTGYGFFCVAPVYVAFTLRLGFKRGLFAMCQSLVVVVTLALMLNALHATALAIRYPELSNRAAVLLAASSEYALADVWRAVVPAAAPPSTSRDGNSVKIVAHEAPFDSYAWLVFVRATLFLGLIAPLARRCRQRRQVQRLRILLSCIAAAVAFTVCAELLTTSASDGLNFKFGIFSHTATYLAVAITSFTWLILFASVAFGARMRRRTGKSIENS